ncbi:uncharacterized protein L969DRAFT_74895 [Mixia osmundae IAM 14324]|uniref:Autophagy-related protein 13 n=1 Tax=Mixia osmundae (strain CBS 9802 / IAM 14324 / JCM 22182 / KY 12970) TaxID=764103 RepID=G7DVW2_MIXOS|nr:uncharacterized protein L969DRAFT_74895 [Mixia osmundae IAM 14324]KEI39599.1 hypothetical protein L969DRAFT_74895 [Mixia osmundae IAM 14324]GAA94722.1 hypothetical protein E5Q_01375 [Mixia osmundae IAM 14324]
MFGRTTHEQPASRYPDLNVYPVPRHELGASDEARQSPSQVQELTPSPQYGSVESTGETRARFGTGESAVDAKKRAAKVDQLLQQVYSKTAAILTEARLTHVQGEGSNLQAQAKRTNKWFNLELEDTEIFKEELKLWRSITALLSSSSSPRASTSSTAPAVPPMVLDIILDTCDLAPNDVLVLRHEDGKTTRLDDLQGILASLSASQAAQYQSYTPSTTPQRVRIVLERWTLQFSPPAPPIQPELPHVYKLCTVLFRALHSLIRTLPAYALHRQLRKRGRPTSSLKIGCRMSMVDPMDSIRRARNGEVDLDIPLGPEPNNAAPETYTFSPVLTPVGFLQLSGRYRPDANFQIQDHEALISSRFIDEDFFKPTVLRPGSLPLRPGLITSATAPTQVQTAYGSAPLRQSLAVPTAQPAPPVTTAASPMPFVRSASASQEGAFLPASRPRSGSLLSGSREAVPASPDSLRRPSMSSLQSVRIGSPSSLSLLRQGSYVSSAPLSVIPQDIAVSGASNHPIGSPSTGPSSSLRYVGHGSGSSLSNMQRISTSPQPLGSLPRYSSSRYGRSSGAGSSLGSSGGVAQAPGQWLAEAAARRIVSGSAGSSTFAPSGSPSFESRRSESSADSGPTAEAKPPQDLEDFLALLDSKPQLSSPEAKVSPATLKSQADARLRAMAGSVYRTLPAVSKEGLSPTRTSFSPLSQRPIYSVSPLREVSLRGPASEEISPQASGPPSPRPSNALENLSASGAQRYAFPRYVSTRRRPSDAALSGSGNYFPAESSSRGSGGLRDSCSEILPPVTRDSGLDDEAVGRLDLSQDDHAPNEQAYYAAHHLPLPPSGETSRAESPSGPGTRSIENSLHQALESARGMQLGRGRGRPGRLMQQRDLHEGSRPTSPEAWSG